jgi:hypothetical protein
MYKTLENLPELGFLVAKIYTIWQPWLGITLGNFFTQTSGRTGCWEKRVPRLSTDFLFMAQLLRPTANSVTENFFP